MKDLISMRELSKKDILALVDISGKIEAGEISPDLNRKVAALIFLEPSTRTHFSFDTAMKRLGGQTISMIGTETTSLKKGESFSDTLKTISMYADIIVIRSPIEGAARYASECVNIPVINAGDGTNQHPTQSLLDLYSIVKTQGTLENLTLGIVGDLKHGRTVHSLVQALSHFSPTLYFFSPSFLKMPDDLLDDLAAKGIRFEVRKEIDETIYDLDLLYVTRIQKERFSDLEDYERVKGSYRITRAMLAGVKTHFKIFHPLPRVDEISPEVDDTSCAYYFQQAKNGVYMRQAIISTLLECLP